MIAKFEIHYFLDEGENTKFVVRDNPDVEGCFNVEIQYLAKNGKWEKVSELTCMTVKNLQAIAEVATTVSNLIE